MKKVLEIARQENPNLVDLVEEVLSYLGNSSEVIQCEEGSAKFVSMGAVNHSMRVLLRAVEKAPKPRLQECDQCLGGGCYMCNDTGYTF